MGASMRASGTKTYATARASNDTPQATPTTATSSKEKLTVRVFTLGKMAKCMTVSGLQVLNTAMAFGAD